MQTSNPGDLKLSCERFPDVPSPENSHVWVKVNSLLEPQWTNCPILPDKLIDLMNEQSESDDGATSDDSDDEGDDDENGADSDWSSA